jgi:hypothetical protein
MVIDLKFRNFSVFSSFQESEVPIFDATAQPLKYSSDAKIIRINTEENIKHNKKIYKHSS